MTAVNFADLPNNTASSWWRDRGMRLGMIHIMILYLAVFSLGYDGSLLNGLQALPSWQTNFGQPRSIQLGLIAATYYLPKIPTTFLVAYMVDRLGRKIPLYIGSVFMLAGALFGGLSHSRAELIGARVLLGIGTAFAQVTACALVPELAHPRIRHMAGGFLNTTWFIGSILASWTTFACVYYPDRSSNWAWRIPTLLQGVGPVVLCLGVFFVPQSPRWLVRNGRHEEAHRILAKYHANGDMDDPLVNFEMREIKINVTLEAKANSSGWLSFFKTVGNRRRFFIIIMMGSASQWLGNGLVSYFLVPILNEVGIQESDQLAGINGGLAIWSWFAAMTGAGLCERFGRRPLFLVSLAGCFISFVFITALSGSFATTKKSSTGVAMIPFLFLFNSAHSLAFSPLPMLYTPEISPFALRAKSAALLVLSQNLAQTFNQFANPVALAAIAWKYYIVYVAVIAVYFTLFWFFIRETKGLTVEEAAVVYEPDDNKHAVQEQERQMAAEIGGAEGDEAVNEENVKGDDQSSSQGAVSRV